MASIEFKQLNGKLVEKILEQGQKLRNAMVQSILQNDPLNSEIIYDKNFNTPISSVTTFSDKKLSDTNLLEAFLKGDYLTKNEEETALNTIRTMSVSDVCKTTERTLLSKCSCDTCNAYNKNNLKCDLRRTEDFKDKCLSNYIKQKNWGAEYTLKYVDSLKVVLQSINLNNLGNKRVSRGADTKQSNFGVNETYFVEYYIPEIFTKELPKSKSKIDSGLESNHVRVCARRTSEVIYIRQIFIHNICNLYDCNLEDHNLSFFVRYKSRGQKNSELLGVAKFNFAYFVSCKNFSCCKTLPIYLNENNPIIIGTLKVTLQLGCGKIYFGQEFVDAVFSEKLPSDEIDSGEEFKDVEANYKNSILKEGLAPEKEVKKEIQQDKPATFTKPNFVKPQVALSKSVPLNGTKDKNIANYPLVEKADKVPKSNENLKKELLLGFIYASEAQFLNVCPSSYILCQPYCQSDTSSSKVLYNSSNPLYNFCQIVPLLYEDDILLKLRENFMVIEFWEKNDQTDLVFGLTRLSLHQFYLAYRNAVILQHLKRNKLPIIGTDWWEPIYSSDSHELIGQVQVLTALGTEEQIRNLEFERGFKDDIVKAKFPNSIQVRANVKALQNSSYFRGGTKVFNKKIKLDDNNEVNTLNNKGNTSSFREPSKELKSQRVEVALQLDKGVNTVNNLFTSREPLKEPKPKTIDVAVQSDIQLIMASNDKSQNLPQMQDMLSSFMKLLEPKPVRMDNSTNTEPAMSSGPSRTEIPQNTESELQVRQTSDLLDSLQKALTLDSKPVKKVQKPPSFHVQVLINSANQLPSRRKIKSKSKRNKGKSPRQEENILPSTYVSFESMPGDTLHVTKVFSKSTSPQWNYKCEVNLPLDFLTNGQKRLIFKVWKKYTNAVLQPNMQTDVVLGFAAVDLSVLLAGLPNIQGWFNIVDFSGKCNGQINIHVNPLEKLGKLSCPSKEVVNAVNSNVELSHLPVEKEEPDELLSRALKRKFTELDEITQRLRLRLSEVVSDDSEGSNDEIAEEFENDINNLCIEEDFDLINFEEETRKLNSTYNPQISEKQSKPRSSSDLLSLTSQPGSSKQSIEQAVKVDEKLYSDIPELSASRDNSSENADSCATDSSFMDKHIMQGKQRIDTLLEKLSLINSEVSQPFASRYVSGCSVSNEDTGTQDILKNLDHTSRPNITAGSSYDPLMFHQLYGGSQSCGSLSSNLHSGSILNSNLGAPATSGSETSVITNFSECRPNPDGQGTNSDDKGT